MKAGASVGFSSGDQIPEETLEGKEDLLLLMLSEASAHGHLALLLWA
jgi:hypothetical protein